MSVRSARLEDAAAWEQLRQAQWPSEPGEHASEIARYFAGDLREPQEVLLAFDEHNEAVGVVELSIRAHVPGCTTDRVAFIEGWYVDPAARRTGVGRMLVEAAETWGREQGCTEMGSDTDIDNAQGAAAHLAVGFTDAGALRCFRKDL